MYTVCTAKGHTSHPGGGGGRALSTSTELDNVSFGEAPERNPGEHFVHTSAPWPWPPRIEGWRFHSCSAEWPPAASRPSHQSSSGNGSGDSQHAQSASLHGRGKGKVTWYYTCLHMYTVYCTQHVKNTHVHRYMYTYYIVYMCWGPGQPHTGPFHVLFCI